MRAIKTTLLIACIQLSLNVNAQTVRKESSFDDNWKFKKDATAGAAIVGYNDKAWRTVDLPHDWSIEPLENQSPGSIIGPFSKDSPGTTATGYTMGGTGWYRKTFTFSPTEKYSQTIINFDGVYMNCEVWVNGKLLANQPYGYTPFDVDISAALNPAGKPNVIAVKVPNEGKNSRWYSGSGIYRHVTLIRKQPVHLAQNSVSITTENLNNTKATVKVASFVENSGKASGPVQLSVKIIDPNGKVVQTVKSSAKPLTGATAQFEQNIPLKNGKKGVIQLKVEGEGLNSAQISVNLK